MLNLDQWRSAPIFTNSVTAWLIAACTAIGVLVALLALRLATRRYAERLRATPHDEFLEVPMLVFSRTTLVFFLIVALYAGLRTLVLGEKLQTVINTAATIAFFWQAGLWMVAALRAVIARRRTHTGDADRAVLGSLGIISFLANALIWSLVLLLTLDNLGVNITALVAGLGIGGVAVALALQNVLGDLFASLSIALDRPFVVGDVLSIDTFVGAVENIGIKSTRLRSVDGEQIVIANGELLKSRMRNFGRMRERRVVFATSIAYETPFSLIERIPGLLRDIVEAQRGVRFDRAHFQKHGVASIDFETVYYVTSPDYNLYMDIQQAINLGIHRKFLELQVPFASSTQRALIDFPKPAEPAPSAQPEARGAARRAN